MVCLLFQQPRTNYCKRSLSYSGVVLWNSLPLNIRQSLCEFKSNLKNYDFDSSHINFILFFFYIYTRLPCKAGFIISLIVVVIYNINLVR